MILKIYETQGMEVGIEVDNIADLVQLQDDVLALNQAIKRVLFSPNGVKKMVFNLSSVQEMDTLELSALVSAFTFSVLLPSIIRQEKEDKPFRIAPSIDKLDKLKKKDKSIGYPERY